MIETKGLICIGAACYHRCAFNTIACLIEYPTHPQYKWKASLLTLWGRVTYIMKYATIGWGNDDVAY